MDAQKILSADSHVIEPADVWTARIDKRFLDRAPRVIKHAGSREGDFFAAEGLRPFPVAGFAVAGVDPKDFAEKMAGGYPRRPSQRVGSRAANQGPGTRRRLGRGVVSEPRDAPVPNGGRRAARGVLSRIQRLAGRLSRGQPAAPGGSRDGLARRSARRSRRTQARCEQGSARCDDMGRGAGRASLQRPVIRSILGGRARSRNANQPAYPD